MNKQAKILLAMAACVGVGVALATTLYNASKEPPASARVQSGVNAGTGYGMNFREELIRPDSHARGPEDASVTIVEFLDPECEACKAFHPTMKGFLKENEGKVRFVVRYMAFHTSSRMAVAAAEAAGLQGKYWEMLDLLFETAGEWGHQPAPVPAFFEKYAQTLGLDVARFKDDLVDQKWQTLVDRDMSDGQVMGVRGTPTIFFNGDVLRDLSSEALQREFQKATGTSAK